MNGKSARIIRKAVEKEVPPNRVKSAVALEKRVYANLNSKGRAVYRAYLRETGRTPFRR